MSDQQPRLRVLSFLTRQRFPLAIALVAVLASSGTAAAVSYLVLGGINSAGATTTLKSGVNGAVLQVTNTNSAAGSSARGLAIAVPAGRAPLTVSTTAGKATNLNADKLDGLDGAAFARGTGVSVLANRVVLAEGQQGIVLLSLPGLGTFAASCQTGQLHATIGWTNTTSSVIDIWSNYTADGRLSGTLAPPDSFWVAAYFDADTDYQTGDTFIVGRGNNPGTRTTATVTLAAFRSGPGAPCGAQATAEVWSTP